MMRTDYVDLRGTGIEDASALYAAHGRVRQAERQLDAARRSLDCAQREVDESRAIRQSLARAMGLQGPREQRSEAEIDQAVGVAVHLAGIDDPPETVWESEWDLVAAQLQDHQNRIDENDAERRGPVEHQGGPGEPCPDCADACVCSELADWSGILSCRYCGERHCAHHCAAPLSRRLATGLAESATRHSQ